MRALETGQATAGGAPAAPLPEPRTVTEWTQVNSAASHNGGHIAGSAALTQVWRTDTGGGDGRITGQPIILGGTVYVLNGESEIAAIQASSGNRAWTTTLAPEGEDGSDGFGGGLAAEGGTIFATTGFGEVLAVSSADGSILWRQKFGAPFRAAPAVLNGVVAAVGRDNQAYGLDAATGQPLWRLAGAAADAGFLGGASPAMAGDLVVLPFASGELVGATATGGQRVWSAALTGGRRGLARSAIPDLTGDPVIVGPFVVAANQSGRMAAIQGQTGQRVWTNLIGSTGPLWAAGETLFVMGDDARLRRLSVRDGRSVWEAVLPAFDDMEDREGAIAYSGPILVGGRIVVASTEGDLFAFDAETGNQTASADIGAGSNITPAAANGLIYVLTDDGDLYAFR